MGTINSINILVLRIIMMSKDIAELNKYEIISLIIDGKLDEADLLELVSDNDFDIEFAVVKCEYSTEPILDIAAHDRDDRIRLAVVNKKGCSVRTLKYLLKDSNSEIASIIARRIKEIAKNEMVLRKM